MATSETTIQTSPRELVTQAEAKRAEMRGWTPSQWMAAYSDIQAINPDGCPHTRMGPRTYAHAHNHQRDRWGAFGAICLNPKTRGSGWGRHPELTMLHEIAHLVAFDHKHDRAFYGAFNALVASAFGGIYEPIRRLPTHSLTLRPEYAAAAAGSIYRSESDCPACGRYMLLLGTRRVCGDCDPAGAAAARYEAYQSYKAGDDGKAARRSAAAHKAWATRRAKAAAAAA